MMDERVVPSTAGFSTSLLCAITGVSERQADYWARSDLLRPSVCAASGSGSKRRWSRHDLFVAYCMKTMLNAGMGGESLGGWTHGRNEVLRDIAMLLRSHHDTSGCLVRTAGGWSVVRDDDLLALLNAQAVFFVLSLSAITTALDDAIARRTAKAML